ncbi:multicopper oxidase family protein [Sesbania bispinosa]|nr:multicopper oxidase family protein [Sesbania bispinosa]
MKSFQSAAALCLLLRARGFDIQKVRTTESVSSFADASVPVLTSELSVSVGVRTESGAAALPSSCVRVRIVPLP